MNPSLTVSRSQPVSSLGRPCGSQFSTFSQLRVNQWIETQILSCIPPQLPPPDWPPPSTPPISRDHGLQVHFRTRLITAFKCLSGFTRSWSPSASPHSLDHGQQVHLWVHSIPASKCISEFTRSQSPSESRNTPDHGLQVHLYGGTAGVQRYRCNGGGQSHRKYIFGRPWSK